MTDAGTGKNCLTISRQNAPSIVDDVERELARVLRDRLALGWGACKGTDPIPVLWVRDCTWSPIDLTELIPSGTLPLAATPAFEILGAYIAFSDARRPRIELCARAILQAAIRFRKKFRPDMATKDLFRLFTTATILHELAHAMMDGVDNACEGLATVDRPVRSENRPTRLLTPPPVARNALPDMAQQDFGYVIEESLADAFILAQPFPPDEKEILTSFVANGPVPYRHATGWVGPVLEAMRSWRRYKTLDAVATMAIMEKEGRAAALPAREIAKALLAGQEVPTDRDFHAEFQRYVASDSAGDPAPSGTCTSAPNAVIPPGWRRFLDEMAIQHWSVRADGVDVVVDVDGDVDMSGRGLRAIAVKFGTVRGNFDCSNNRLTSLENLPQVVHGSLYCCNNAITQIRDIPCARIDGIACFCGNAVAQCSLGLLDVQNLSGIHADGNKDAFSIVARYLKQPDDRYACHAALIDEGHDEFATP